MERSDDGPSLNPALNPASTAQAERDLALATWGLFVGLALLLLAAGLFGTLLGVRSELIGLPTAVSSLISASYYAGFLVGSRIALAALGRVGHIRVYAALASLLSAAMLAVGLTESAPAWAWLRFVTGLCLAGQYVVAESWLNDLATNENRGRLLAIYAVVTSGAFGIGQVLLFAMDPLLITGFAIASIITSLAVAPVALSEDAVAPSLSEREHISLRELAKVVPTGVGSCLLVGIAHGALTGMAAIYATRVGLSTGQIGLFVAAPNIGGMVLHWPVSAASDDIDRRAVGFAASIGAIGAAALLLLGPSSSPMALLLDGTARRIQLPAVFDRRRIHERLDRAGTRQRRSLAVGHALRSRRRDRPVRRSRNDDRGGTRGLLLGRYRPAHVARCVLRLPNEGVARAAGETAVERGVAAGPSLLRAGHVGGDGSPLSTQGHPLSRAEPGQRVIAATSASKPAVDINALQRSKRPTA